MREAGSARSPTDSPSCAGLTGMRGAGEAQRHKHEMTMNDQAAGLIFVRVDDLHTGCFLVLLAGLRELYEAVSPFSNNRHTSGLRHRQPIRDRLAMCHQPVTARQAAPNRFAVRNEVSHSDTLPPGYARYRIRYSDTLARPAVCCEASRRFATTPAADR